MNGGSRRPALGARSLAVLLLAAAMPLAAQDAPATVDSTALYHQLLEQLNKGDTLIDVTTLRYAYAASPDYSPMRFAPKELRDAVLAALEAHTAAKARAPADSLVALDPLGVEPHVLRSAVRRAAGNAAGAAIDAAIARAVIRSVLASGDGTQQHPWIVISVSEEYAVLASKGLRRSTQRVDECRGRPCDALTIAGPSNSAQATLYFDVSISMNYLNRELKND